LSTIADAPSSPADSPWLHALVANIQDAIIVLDERGQIVFESRSASGLLGGEKEDQPHSFGIHRIHPEEREAVIRSFERTLSLPGSVARATYRFQRTDGGWQHLEAIAKNLLHHGDLRGVLITLRDVTERIRALESAEKAGAARDEFMSRMSHELRTPLHAILGWAQLLQSRDDALIDEAIEQITAAGQHLLRLVDEVLDLAAVREGRIALDLQPVEIEPVVADAIDMIHPLAKRRDICIRVDPRGPRRACLMADPIRVRQILINLLSNAVKYSRYAGEVVIGWSIDGAATRLYVIDSGPGMPEEKLNFVFQRFERLGMESAGIEGSGLGLAISRRLVEMMNGTIGVESRPGAGAEFWFRLPGWRRMTAMANASDPSPKGRASSNPVVPLRSLPETFQV
jgi:PAS domain S-box-containing protein